MGHERVGFLPKTRRWRDLVAEIASFGGEKVGVAQIARKTLRQVQARYQTMPNDRGVAEAFRFLVMLARSGSPENRAKDQAHTGLRLPKQHTPFMLCEQLRRWIDQNRESLEYAEVAAASACDAMTKWTQRSSSRQGTLFREENGFALWQDAGTGAGFCSLAESFFASLTTRYLAYFLDREASAALGSMEARDSFDEHLKKHVATVAQHAFETAEITQSFAAGWFNKHARHDLPDSHSVQRFLHIAFGKLRDELLQEARQ